MLKCSSTRRNSLVSTLSAFSTSSPAGRALTFGPFCRISFNRDQLSTIQERHDSLTKTAEKQRAALESLNAEKETKQAEIEGLEQEVEEAKEAWEESKRAWEEKNQELEDVRKSTSKAAKALDKALKDIASCVRSLVVLLCPGAFSRLTIASPEQNDEIERLSSERFAIYRRCKMEEIDLPLSKGSLDDIPIEEVSSYSGTLTRSGALPA